MNGNGSIPAALLARIEKLEADNKSHHETFAKLVDSGLMDAARIAAIERVLLDVAMEALGDTKDTADLVKRVDKYFHQKLAEIKNFKADS
jgi:hypothetical protein